MSTTSLTGPFDTDRLPRIADEPVTVTVSRTPRRGREAEFEQWLERATATLATFPGSLGVGVLRPGDRDGEWHIVFRFRDGLSLRAWERSPQRAVLNADIDAITEDMKVRRTVGVDDWFELPDRAMPKRPLLHRLVGDALWVYPVALASAVFVSPLLAKLSIGVRTLVSGLLITAVSQLVLGPARRWLRRRRRFG